MLINVIEWVLLYWIYKYKMYCAVYIRAVDRDRCYYSWIQKCGKACVQKFKPHCRRPTKIMRIYLPFSSQICILNPCFLVHLWVVCLLSPSFKTLWWQINLRGNLVIVTPSEGGSITVSHAGIKLQQGPWTLLLKHLP